MTKHLSSPDDIFEELCKEIKEQKLQNKTVMAVFDLDSTILEVGPRMSQILRDFAKIKHHISKYPKECSQLERYTHHPKDWSLESSLERIGLAASSFEFYKDLKRFWRTRFFSNDYLHLDEPMPGAQEFLMDLSSIGVQISYLSAREAEAMQEGTVESLKNLGFPLADQFQNLFLKNGTPKSDAEFKRDEIKKLVESHGSVWFFDNEPINLRIVKETLPSVRLVYIDTVHSGREPVPNDIATIANFQRTRNKDRVK